MFECINMKKTRSYLGEEQIALDKGPDYTDDGPGRADRPHDANKSQVVQVAADDLQSPRGTPFVEELNDRRQVGRVHEPDED